MLAVFAIPLWYVWRLNYSTLRTYVDTQTEPPFLVAQAVILALFTVLAVLAAKRFRGASISRL